MKSYFLLCQVSGGTEDYALKGWLIGDGQPGSNQEGRTDDDGVVLEGVMGSLHGGDGARHGTGATCGSHCIRA